ncbi:MAG: hypothetical protein M1835_003323, partial [Candelina submexicana]
MKILANRVFVKIIQVPVDIPLEILLNVFSHLAKKDVKNGRLACKDFNAAGSRYLFDSVFISPLRRDLDIFLRVVRHPVFSKTVREIIWNEMRLLPECHNTSGWKTWFGNSSGSARLLPTVQIGSLDSCRGFYLNTLTEIDAIKRTGEDFAVLCAGLSAMPTVERIILTDDGGQHKTNKYHPPAICNLPAALLPLSYWPRTLLEVDVLVWRQETSPYHGFTVIIRAISKIRARVREFIVDTRCCGLSHRLFLDTPQNINMIYQSFRNFRVIDLVFTLHHCESQALETLDAGNIGKALAKAQSLEHLILTFDDLTPAAIPLYKVLGSGTWLRLKVFEFVTFYTSQPDLLQFVKRHSMTLRQVNLTGVALSDDTWEAFLEYIRL